jgi:hypothetical protein
MLRGEGTWVGKLQVCEVVIDGEASPLLYNTSRKPNFFNQKFSMT